MTTPTPRRTLSILGTRGVPACHGGFETFAENFSIHLAERGWDVSVYCQEIGHAPIREEMWNGVRRIVVHVPKDSALGSILFDLKAILHARKHSRNCLTLGYNTAIFNILLRGRGIRTLMNMDGIEWARAKWSLPARAWLYLNEYIGAHVSETLIADHPEISRHLQRHTKAEKIVTIPYGAETPTNIDVSCFEKFGVEPGAYAMLVARPEPENSILEIVRGWAREKRGMPLLVLGNYTDESPYHCIVKSHESDEIRFVGGIYDHRVLASLRCHSSFYIHGHQVGGTNPSLVEALACGNPVLAHDNRFNRWVAGDAALFFASEDECSTKIGTMIADKGLLANLATNARKRHAEALTLDKVNRQYEEICTDPRTGI